MTRRHPPHIPARQRLAAAALITVGLSAACSSVAPNPTLAVLPSAASSALAGTDVSDVVPRPALRLTTTDGRPFDLQRRPAGEITMLFFGYTRCPDLCPTVMADLTTARRMLPPEIRPRVQIVFVTEDPQHDRPAVLRAWLDRFDPTIIGLLGGNPVTRDVLDALKTTRTDRLTGRDRAVEHTGSVYAFFRATTVVYTGGTTPSQYAADLRKLLT